MNRSSKLYRGRAVAAGLAALAAVALGGLTATSAQADTAAANVPAAQAATIQGAFVADGVNIRSGPSTDYPSLGQGFNGQRIYVYCEVHATQWYHLLNRATGLNGYSRWPGLILLDNGSPNPPEC